ncbi:MULTISPECIES: pseudouridine synthase [Staphylococcus]|uniref:pseudouridine synthase n=1 Tax=Staphylococcus TaxID=1279 RepID=UPI00124CB349|nr:MULTISPECIES: pseudouridine synthase [Staphylococcus]KAB2478499.1 rRNA pseudouridine synthase [Staphylococcus sp. CH99b_3]MCD8838410.1 rRNA pseudouridine synthase [Staphylococcus arlettae]MCD8865417.1 rRNA pseudouridine synthase [Staphylococcus arlettae]
MRIDKFLANMGVGTRTEVKQLLKKGRVTLNGTVEKSAKTNVNALEDYIAVDNNYIVYIDKLYLMLNKPQGYVCATEDNQHQTVIDLFKDYKDFHIFPVGRLDKDTEGLLLITNDGDFSHQLMSPNKHVSKTYEVLSEKSITNNDIELFKTGIELHDGLAKPATLVKAQEERKSFVTITEGRYHQVKRMFHAINNEVLALKRISIGDLQLDEQLAVGEYRHLKEQDFEQLGIK